MTRYLAARAVQTAITLALMSLIVFVLIGLMPGDPIDMMISGDPQMTSEDAARLRALYGLDKPLLERYLAWATQAAQGNFGYSRSFAQPVLTVLWPRLLNTLQLAGIAFILATAVALLRAYAASLEIDLAYQGFDSEMAAMPGKVSVACSMDSTATSSSKLTASAMLEMTPNNM